MKLTLKNGTVIDVVDVEESYYPRNTQGGPAEYPHGQPGGA